MRLTQKLLATKIRPMYGNENTDGESYPEKTLGELLQWALNDGRMRYGLVMLHGWTYNLSKYMEEYFVETDTDRYHRIHACNEQMARDLLSVPSTAKVYKVPQKTNGESKISLARKEFMNILDLATCDDTLYNDGINLELEACAKQGLKILEGEK